MPRRAWQLSSLAPALGLVVAGAIAPNYAAAAPAAAVAAPATYPERIERLARVVRLWGTVRFHHPYLAYKDIDWDEALVAAAPRVLTAKSRQEYAAVVRTLLDAMGDPVTHLVDARHDAADGQAAAPPATPAAPGAPTAPAAPTPLWPQLRRVQEGVAVVDLGPSTGWSAYVEMREQGRRLGPQIGKAKGLVFDLRQPEAADVASFVLLEPLAGLLASRRTHAPAQRTVRHAGYHTQGPVGGSGGYSSFFETAFADDVVPVPGASPKRVVFVVNGDTSLPPLALALQRSGDGFIVFEGSKAGWSEESVVQQLKVDLGEELWATVRLSELVPEPAWSGLHADLEVPPAAPAPRPEDGGAAATGKQDPALAAAIGLASGSAPPAGTSGAGGPRLEPLPQGVWRPDRAYEAMTAPDLGHRVLAVARIWNVIHYFYAYLELIGDWDAVLPQFLARMEGAAGARPYALAVAEMMTHVADGHSQVTGGEIDRFFGEAGVPVALRRVEGSWVVTALGDAPEVKASGLEIGDVVEAVDGEPAAARVERLSRYLPASTPAGLSAKVGRVLLAGPEGSTAELALRGRQGAKQVKLRRSRAGLDLGHSKLLYNNPFWSTAVGESVRVLPGNLGYVDLTRLTPQQVKGMFERLEGTRAIIFDGRGYPNGTAWQIAPRLGDGRASVAAQFRQPEVSAAEDQSGSGTYFSQRLPVTAGFKYGAPTVMLIDERTVSQTEHTGLFFEAANGTRFIGSQTAGANGDVTFLTVPGGLSVRFSGHDVRHADGRQLQRVGLTPDVEVAPTIQGIREGRDEVLERAIRWLDGDGK
ncbi:MAG TPA: S41 family peptidase [Thermoanaerobaculia bacterium]|nr:S41 family peptidase [Thermoanaerobaculia bacterium]